MKQKSETKPDISIVLLTMNPPLLLFDTLNMIFAQEISCTYEVLVIDSESEENYIQRLTRYPIKLIRIRREEFGHGKTRNLAVELAQGSYVVFLTQDSVPINSNWLESLIGNLTQKEVAGVYGRQIPRKDANIFEQFFLSRTYPEHSFVKSRDKIKKLNWKNIMFSNANSAIKKEVWLKHKFREDLLMSEDQAWSKSVLLDNYKIIYCSSAAVFHSHQYSIKSLFKRNFDNGFALRSITQDSLGSISIEASCYIFEEVCFLKQHGLLTLTNLSKMLLYEATKAFGFYFGSNHSFLPHKLKKYFTLHPNYFQP